MNSRERIIAAIKHEDVDKLPLMYRGLTKTSEKLLEYFGIYRQAEKSQKKENKKHDYYEDLFLKENWQQLINLLGADAFSDGSAFGRYTLLQPKYIGPHTSAIEDPCLAYAWGLDTEIKISRSMEYPIFGVNKPMRDFTSIKEVDKYPSPEIENFDFSEMTVSPEIKKIALYAIGSINMVFMIASWLRGQDNFLFDMAANPIMAEAIINKVGEFATKLNRKILDHIGHEVDHYRLWDDVALQNQMFMSPSHWHKYFEKWYRILFEDAKKYGLPIVYHCCGTFHPIIPSLIDIGVDILDPIQTSAKDMDLKTLKKWYGMNLCFHGGIDVQKLLPFGSVYDIKRTVKEAKELFGLSGGLILGPSHDILPDTPIENILAVYED